MERAMISKCTQTLWVVQTIGLWEFPERNIVMLYLYLLYVRALNWIMSS